MTNIDRVRVALTGFPGGPGVCTFYGLNGTTLVPPLRALWGSLATAMPGDVSIKVISNGDTIEDTTGALTGSWSIADATGVVGTGTTGYAAPIGAVITWLTDTILDKHRVKGRTFVVPTVSEAFATDGTLVNTTQASIKGFADAYVLASAANSVVWHRPRAARAANGTIPARVARVGGHALISGSRVPDMAAVLRSRRD